MWNLHTREIQATNDSYDVSGSPLRWFHFDGYSPDTPQMLSAELERPRVRLGDRPGLARALPTSTALGSAPLGTTRPRRRPGNVPLPDGREIDARMRRMYVYALRDARERGEPEPPSPFGAAGGADAFVDWLAEPVAPPPEPLVSRRPHAGRQEDESIQEVFPSLAGREPRSTSAGSATTRTSRRGSSRLKKTCSSS